MTPGAVRLKRVYLPPEAADGQRILVERLWPRGLSKRKARIDAWHRDVAPSPELRKWFAHRSERWVEFQKRYAAELETRPDAVMQLRQAIAAGPATFVFAARDEAHNNAVALREYLASHRTPRPSGGA